MCGGFNPSQNPAKFQVQEKNIFPIDEICTENNMDNVEDSLTETILKWPPLDIPWKNIVRIIMKLFYPGLEINNGLMSLYYGYSLCFVSYYRVFDRGKCNRNFFSFPMVQ